MISLRYGVRVVFQRPGDALDSGDRMRSRSAHSLTVKVGGGLNTAAAAPKTLAPAAVNLLTRRPPEQNRHRKDPRDFRRSRRAVFSDTYSGWIPRRVPLQACSASQRT